MALLSVRTKFWTSQKHLFCTGVAYLALALVFAKDLSARDPIPPKPQSLHAIMMKSTFLVRGEGSLGTAFLVGRPLETNPDRAQLTLVTADHVLKSVKGEEVTLMLRVERAPGDWSKISHQLRISENGQQLWASHPTADVAAMYVRIPTTTIPKPIVSVDMLADDRMWEELEVSPGDPVYSLGFPLGAESPAGGFPILRSGEIASFPLVPTATVGHFLFDFEVFKGNSGGPVYFSDSNRTYNGRTRLGTVWFLAGIVSHEITFDEIDKGQYSLHVSRERLALAKVIHASLIKETILSLPAPDANVENGQPRSADTGPTRKEE